MKTKFVTTTLSVIICALLCFTAFAPVVACAEDQNDLVLIMSGGMMDDKVYVDVDVRVNRGVGTLKLLLDYDKTALSYNRALNTSEALKSLAYTTTGKEVDADGIRYLYGPGKTDTSTGRLLRLYFNVADGAKAGTYKIGLTVEGALDGTKDIDVAVYGARVELKDDNTVTIVTETPVETDVGMIVAIVLASLAVVALVVIVAVRVGKRKQAADRTEWNKID